ncbi:hypothetical protein [Streptomyces wuyuanensis]|uniref:hypothetical protein n=1 Tax=Streptomyces wuyuanensis TaxID=1196353 RepID=UPI0034469764
MMIPTRFSGFAFRMRCRTAFSADVPSTQEIPSLGRVAAAAAHFVKYWSLGTSTPVLGPVPETNEGDARGFRFEGEDTHSMEKVRALGVVPSGRRRKASVGRHTPHGPATGILGTGQRNFAHSDDQQAFRHPSTGTLCRTAIPEFPGRHVFGPGRTNAWVLMLRLRLIIRGYADDQLSTLELDDDLTTAQTWDDQLRSSCTHFQLAQGWRGELADGFPTRETWRQLWAA